MSKVRSRHPLMTRVHGGSAKEEPLSSKERLYLPSGSMPKPLLFLMQPKHDSLNSQLQSHKPDYHTWGVHTIATTSTEAFGTDMALVKMATQSTTCKGIGSQNTRLFTLPFVRPFVLPLMSFVTKGQARSCTCSHELHVLFPFVYAPT